MPNDNDPRRNRPWERGDRDDYDEPPRRRDEFDRPPQPQGNGLAVAGLILGILSFFTLCLTGIPAIICSAIAMGKPAGRGIAIAGLLLGMLGTVAGIGVGIWGYIKATESVGLAADRLRDQNNMKQIGIAFHSQHDANWGMSAPHARDFTGKVNTDLSWRVGILPYIEQQSLYNRFDLTQPWDSAKNKPLSNTPIKTYTGPFDGPEPSVNTPYRVFYGGGAMFNEDGQPVRLTEVTDGTSNTIMTVGAFEQVPWAQPKEFKYDPNGPLPKLGHARLRGGFQVGLVDGSVRFVSDRVSETTLRRAITKADGHALGDDWYD